MPKRRVFNKFSILAWIGLAGFTVFPRAVYAEGLVWKRTEIEIKAQMDQEEVEAIYPFKNTGREEITIRSVSTSCGCTVAAPDKKTYGPGEEGEIKALFTIGDRNGTQEKTILVETSDAAQPTMLALKVTIPEAFALEPRFLMWSAGTSGPIQERAAVLSASPGQTISIASVQSESSELESRVVIEEPGKRYRILLRPKTITAPFKALVRLRIACPPGRDREVVIYAIAR